MDAGDEEIGTRVAADIVLAVRRWAAVSGVSCCSILSLRGEKGLTGYRDRSARHCERESCPYRDGHRAETCCGRGRSHGARLHLRQQSVQTAGERVAGVSETNHRIRAAQTRTPWKP